MPPATKTPAAKTATRTPEPSKIKINILSVGFRPGEDGDHLTLDISGLKPGKQQAAIKFFNDLGKALKDGRLDIFEGVGLIEDLKDILS